MFGRSSVMNIERNYSNNISMRGLSGNGGKSALNRFKQYIFNKLPNKTFTEEGNIKRWNLWSDRMSRPAENRMIMGGTAIVMQPAIDYFNPRTDEETRTVSMFKDIAKIGIGTGSGIIVRGSMFKLVNKMTEIDGNKNYSKWLLPSKKWVEKMISKPQMLANYRNAISTGTAILVMLFTNFAVDLPLTLLTTNYLVDMYKKHKKDNQDTKEVLYG